MHNLTAEDQKLYDENRAAVDARFAELIAAEQDRVMQESEESGVAEGFSITPERQEELFQEALHGSSSSATKSTKKATAKDTG